MLEKKAVCKECLGKKSVCGFMRGHCDPNMQALLDLGDNVPENLCLLGGSRVTTHWTSMSVDCTESNSGIGPIMTAPVVGVGTGGAVTRVLTVGRSITHFF